MDKQEVYGDNTRFGDMPDSFFLIGLINRFNNAFQAVTDQMFEEISWKQVFFLNCIGLFQEAPTIKNMADMLGCSHQNAKQILNKLEKTGFVEVDQDTKDRRKQRIRLTAQAREFQKKYSRQSMQAMNELFRGIDDDNLRTTIQVMMQLDNRLKDM